MSRNQDDTQVSPKVFLFSFIHVSRFLFYCGNFALRHFTSCCCEFSPPVLAVCPTLIRVTCILLSFSSSLFYLVYLLFADRCLCLALWICLPDPAHCPATSHLLQGNRLFETQSGSGSRVFESRIKNSRVDLQ